MEVLVFEVAGERGALPVRSVREIVRAVFISPLPGAPEVVEGVIDVRGAIVPVLDLRARLGLPPSPVDPSEHFILLGRPGREIAIRVDRAVGIETVPEGATAQAPALVAAGWNVAGVVQLADGLVVIHDPEAFLTETETLALASALERDARG